MKKQVIHKLIWFAVVLAAILALQACHRTEPTTLQNTSDPTKQNTTSPEQTTVPTEPSTDPTQSTQTDPTQQPTDPTQPSTQPTDSGPWSHEADVIRFLTEVNHSGTIEPEELPPGSYCSVWAIPKADQSYVGSTVEIILSRRLEEVPFFYYYDEESGYERLAVSIDAHIPLMLVLETDLNGISELCKVIAAEEVFSAKVCSATNIDPMEYVHTGNTYYWLPEEQRMDIMSGDVTAVGGMYVGIVGTAYYNTGKVAGIYSDLAVVDLSKEDPCMWLRIFERFGLEDFILEK